MTDRNPKLLLPSVQESVEMEHVSTSPDNAKSGPLENGTHLVDIVSQRPITRKFHSFSRKRGIFPYRSRKNLLISQFFSRSLSQISSCFVSILNLGSATNLVAHCSFDISFTLTSGSRDRSRLIPGLVIPVCASLNSSKPSKIKERLGTLSKSVTNRSLKAKVDSTTRRTIPCRGAIASSGDNDAFLSK